ITPSEHVTTTFSRYTEMIADMLRSLGVDAKATGRNDITIDGRKVSGNAFYHIPDRSIVHGTMLYDTDLRHMANAITPSRSKLESKQVQSVEAHITTLSQYLDMSLDDFRLYAIEYLTDKELKLSTNQLAEIEELSKPYYTPEWIFGRKSDATIRQTRRIEGVGELSTAIKLHEGRIADINIEGDFFLLSDLDSTLLDGLRGVRYVDNEIKQAMSGMDTTQTIAGLKTEQFIELII
ncbi:MAG: lipoyltransferase, partial [Muribaculaceae bacterium]|nr:lipoyltransferase [Muribaculaceae bacterium]